ncbi:MAG: hypothetical protein KF749_03675 [Bacteroidetes bacterium]|nr:hypothetical protein [Bacteroidota bacterium]MCW5897534.1 hypothetical protein [Bacteroidota bacterium]
MRFSAKFTFSDIFSSLFDARIPLLFVLASVAFGIAGNAAFALFLGYLDKVNQGWLWSALAGSITMLFLIAWGIQVVLRFRMRRSTLDGSEAFAIHRKGVIYTVGKSKDLLLASYERQRPEYVGFLCTKESEARAMDTVNEFGISVEHWDKQEVDPWDIKSVHASTGKLLQFMEGKKLSHEESVLDLTGGLTTLSIDAFKAAEEHGVDTQYIRSEYDTNGKRISGTEVAILLTRNQST